MCIRDSFRTALLQSLEIRHNHCQKLDNNRGIDVGDDTHSENSQVFEGTAGNNIDPTEDIGLEHRRDVYKRQEDNSTLRKALPKVIP